MRMFVGVAAALTLASGAAVAAASLTGDGGQARAWVAADGDQAVVAAMPDDQDGPMTVRRLAVLAGRGPQLGVSVRELEGDQAKSATGAVVEDVKPGSAAEKAGIRKGDVITEFDGERVRGVRHLTRLVTETPEGRTVKAAVQRAGARVDLSVTPDSGTLARGDREFEFAVPPMKFERRPGDFDRELRWNMERALPKIPGEAWMFHGGKGRLGVSIQALDGQLGEYFGTDKGVLVNKVEADSPAAKAGLKAGDVVTAVNGKAISEPSELIEEVRKAEDGSTLAIDFTRDRKAQSTKATLEKPTEQPRKRQSARPI